MAGTAAASTGLAAPGTPGKDVHVGGDNDNADNPFIQPPGVTAKQHMDNTDLLFGRANNDLLIGKLGGDTLLGGEDNDILIGGPEKAPGAEQRRAGRRGGQRHQHLGAGRRQRRVRRQRGRGHDDLRAVRGEGRTATCCSPATSGRKVPHVDIDDQAALQLHDRRGPPSEKLGFQFLVRFNVNGTPVVTVRQKDVEKVFCPSPDAGKAMVADLTDRHPTFRNVWLSRVPGTVGAILARWRDHRWRARTSTQSSSAPASPACSPPRSSRGTSSGSPWWTATRCPASPSRAAACRRAGTSTACCPAAGRSWRRCSPATTEDLVARGAHPGRRAGRRPLLLRPAPARAAGTAGLPTLAVSRPLLEWYLRHRLLHDPRVDVLEHTSVLDLAFSADGAGSTGVDRHRPRRRLAAAGRRRPGRRRLRADVADARVAGAARRTPRRPRRSDGSTSSTRPGCSGVRRSPGSRSSGSSRVRPRLPARRHHARLRGRHLDGLARRPQRRAAPAGARGVPRLGPDPRDPGARRRHRHARCRSTTGVAVPVPGQPAPPLRADAATSPSGWS